MSSVPIYTAEDLQDMSVALHHRHKTKKAKQEAAKAALYAPEMTAEHQWTALAVLGGHPQVEEKVGVGVVSVATMPAQFGTRCFMLTRSDGTTTDFSYLKCLTPPSKEQDVRAACRTQIAGQIESFRWSHEPTCDLTGLPLDLAASHVHHAPPMFDVLVTQWADTQGGMEEVYEALSWRDRAWGAFMPVALAQDWQAYHREHARLMLVHPTANLRLESARRSIRAASR